MVNLDLLNGINFRKGCYPGQEIVARTHYLGRLKQRMYLASLPPGHALPAPGTALSAPNFPGQPAGTVFVGLSIDGHVQHVALRLPGDRPRVRAYSAISALDALRRELDRLAVT
jgi:folate-binding Fe-S cluster repair protein YgfZ